MSWIIISIVSYLAGIMASMGLGGGMILIIYLVFFAGMSQLEAQGLNLVFFLPIALIAVIIHSKNKLIEWKKITPAIIAGVISGTISSLLVTYISTDLLSKLFASFLIIFGLKELFTKPH